MKRWDGKCRWWLWEYVSRQGLSANCFVGALDFVAETSCWDYIYHLDGWQVWMRGIWVIFPEGWTKGLYLYVGGLFGRLLMGIL